MISRELAGFLESGLSITVGSRDGALQPDGVVAWAIRVHEDGEHLTLFMHKGAAETLLRNLRTYPAVAVALDRPTSHRACQVKGNFVTTRPARVAERAHIERQVDLFAADLEEYGIPRTMVQGLEIWSSVAIEMRATQLFEQTPGPGAGERMQ